MGQTRQPDNHRIHKNVINVNSRVEIFSRVRQLWMAWGLLAGKFRPPARGYPICQDLARLGERIGDYARIEAVCEIAGLKPVSEFPSSSLMRIQ